MSVSLAGIQAALGTAWHVNHVAICNLLGYVSGSGSPIGVVTPAQVGQEYYDSTNAVFYKAYGTTSASWSQEGAADFLSADSFGQAGGSTGTFGLEGNLDLQISAAGISPSATGADNVLAVTTIPANALNAAKRGVSITAAGGFAANGNNKDVKIIVNPSAAVVGSTVGSGGTTICDTGTVSTNGTGWQLEGAIYKYGVAGSNTQIGLHNQAQIGAAVASMLKPSLITATESGAILVAITGNASTTATDIVFNWLQSNFTN